MEIFLADFFRPETIIEYGGIALLLFVIFAETGLFFGFFLPGDSLLFVAGILCGSPYLPTPIWWLIILIIVAATSGTSAGYGFGYWAKSYLSQRKENFFYRKKYLEVTERFYQRYGMMTFIIGRFLPVVRTFVPILAGIVRVKFSHFLLYNFLGAAIWIIPLTMGGYWLGNLFPEIVHHLDLIIVGMILLSGIPIVLSWNKHRKAFSK